MQYITHYQSPVGDILLAADETGLTGLWFDGQNTMRIALTRSMKKKTRLFWHRQKNG